MNTENMNETTAAAAAPGQMNAERMKDNDIIEIDLAEVFFALLNSWKAIFLAILVGAAVLGAYRTFLVSPSYQASTSIYITNTTSVVSSLSDLQMSAALTGDYANIIKSRGVMNNVIEELNLDTDYKALAKMISVSNPDSTHILNITVTSSDPELARDIANSVTKFGSMQITEVIGNGEPSIIDSASAADVEEVTTGLRKYLLIGGLLGAVLACALVIVKLLTDTTMKTEEDIDKYLQLPILAAVPYYSEK